MDKLRTAITANKQKVQKHREAYNKINQKFQERNLDHIGCINQSWGNIALALIGNDQIKLEVLQNKLKVEMK